MNAVTEINQGSAVATTGYDPFAAYGQEAASNGGAYLKFSKGEWLLGQNDDEVALGRRLAANMDELSIGWIRWADGKPAERRMGLLSQGYKPEARDTLGYTDQAEWETDNDDKAKDPWSFTNELPLADPETGEQMIFSASSKGGIGCMGNLCKSYGKEYKQRDGLVPVIELARDSYKHAVYGKTYVPVVNIVDWIDNATVPVPAAGDEAGEGEKPAAAAAGSKTRF